jgi:hypothetical protein
MRRIEGMMVDGGWCHSRVKYISSRALPLSPELCPTELRRRLDLNFDLTFAQNHPDTTILQYSHSSDNMISRIVRSSICSSKALANLPRTLTNCQRYQSTLPQTATPGQSPQTQQASLPQIAKHPSSVSHPALRDQEPERNNDNAIFLIFGGLLLAGVPLSYWYWGYRERAMKQKKEEMLRGIQERYAARHGSG